MPVVYQATNLINGKRYIGVTCNSLRKRISGHKSGKGRSANMAICRAMKKYGADMIRFSVLMSCASREDAFREEVRLIAQLQPEYNVSKGGKGPSHVPYTSQRREALSQYMKQNGARVWRASAAAHRKKVFCVTDGLVFESCASAADHYGISRSAITMAVRGRRATAGNRVFSFYRKGQDMSADHGAGLSVIREEQRKKMITNTPRRPVVCVTTKQRFTSMAEAANVFGTTVSKIFRVVAGKRRSTRGLVFKYDGE